MSFIETVRRARQLLREEGRISLSALKLEFGLDDARLESLVEELVDIQQAAAREGKALAWIGSAAGEPERAKTTTQKAAPDREPPAEAERRQLTVMFVDLVDSTELSRRLDAEDLRDVVRGYQDRAARVIEHFGGHIAQYLGDGLLVYFGWPRAHEDDAERAVRAGLGIVEAIARGDHPARPDLGQLSVRVGIHTGSVVIGEMGGGATRETLAIGDTANIAARLQAIAGPDRVILSSATLRLVSGIFVTRELGDQRLKGVAEPVRLFEAVQASGVRSRLDVMAAIELTPFIGREQELMLLEDRFAQVTEGSGQAVLVCGEAGIGKSRLVQIFRERLAERAHSWLECRGSPYTQDSALLPVIELQRRGLGFRPEDPAEAKLAAIEAGLVGVDFDLPQTVPLMASLHGVPLGDRYAALDLSPEGTRKKTLALLTEWLLRLGQRQPLVLLMEDLHWMDPSTVDLLGRILEQVPTAPVLLLATYRPDFEPPWGARSHVTPMLLSRFTRAQLADLVRKAARGRDLPDPWVEEILRRADGVPLFAEELTQSVLEAHPEPPEADEIPQLHIPDTLQDSLMARLDALGMAKDLAQLASVLGREFDYELLLAVSPMKEPELCQLLGTAVREELFYQRGAPPAATYLFKHALIRDAAYDSMLRATRQRHHRRVAETLIAGTPRVAEGEPELIAHHLTEAGEVERSLSYWKRAGDLANARAAYEEAVVHARRGLRALEGASGMDSGAQQELDLLMALATALVAARGYASPETQEALERALSVCDRVEEPTRRAVIHYQLGNTLGSAGDPRSALRHYTEALQIGEAEGDERLIVAGHYGRATALYLTGRIQESCEHIERAISLYDPEKHRFDQPGYTEDPGIGSWCEAGWHLWMGGAPDRAAMAAQRGIALARASQQPYNLAFALAWGAVTALYRRDLARAGKLAQEAAIFSDEQGFPMLAGVSRIVGASTEGLEGRGPATIDRLLVAMAEASATGQQGGAAQMLCYLAELQLLYGRPTEAIATLDGALAIAAQSGESYFEAELHRLKGEALVGIPESSNDQTEQAYQRALEIAREQGARSLELRAVTSLARLCRDQGRRTEARNLLQPVYDWFTEGFDTQDLKDARALLEELRP